MSSNDFGGLSVEVVEKLHSVFRKFPGIKKVILYGSRAKGNFKTGSDIDLTVVGDNDDISFLFKIENEIDDLFLPYKVDLSLYSSLDNENLKDHIARIGIEFYKSGG